MKRNLKLYTKSNDLIKKLYEISALYLFISFAAINRHWRELEELRDRKEVEFVQNAKHIGSLVKRVGLMIEHSPSNK